MTVSGRLYLSAWLVFIKHGRLQTEMINITVGGIYGGAFDDFPYWAGSGYNTFKTVHLSCGSTYVSSLTVTYGNFSAPQYGTPITNSMFTVDTEKDGYIIGVDVWHSRYINAIRLITNTGQRIGCGNEIDNFTSVRGEQLLYISGRAGYHIDRLTFHFQDDSDDCSTIPCLNGGSCMGIGQNNDFECECPQGFTGKRCEQDNFTDIKRQRSTTTESTDSLRELLESLKTELKVDSRTTNSYKRTKTCATDKRLSAKIAGNILGVALLCSIALLIFLADVPLLLGQILGRNM